MMFSQTPEIDSNQLIEALKINPELVILDIREDWETELVKLDLAQVLFLPMSILGRDQLQAIPDAISSKESQIIVMCHHGSRSATVTNWLIRNGWVNVKSLYGGIDGYAQVINPAIGFY